MIRNYFLKGKSAEFLVGIVEGRKGTTTTKKDKTKCYVLWELSCVLKSNYRKQSIPVEQKPQFPDFVPSALTLALEFLNSIKISS
jgi:hypothetical protein